MKKSDVKPDDPDEVRFRQELQQRLKELREDHGWTQEFVGNYLGMSGDSYSKYERRGKSVPHLYHLPKLAALYGVSTDLILTGRGIRMVRSAGRGGKLN